MRIIGGTRPDAYRQTIRGGLGCFFQHCGSGVLARLCGKRNDDHKIRPADRSTANASTVTQTFIRFTLAPPSQRSRCGSDPLGRL